MCSRMNIPEKLPIGQSIALTLPETMDKLKMPQRLRKVWCEVIMDRAQLIEEKSKFYSTFINMAHNLGNTDLEGKEAIADPGFRKELMIRQIDARLIEELAPYYVPLVNKPQRVEADLESGYLAVDLATNTYYFCSNTLMVDIDSYKIENGDDVNPCDLLPHCLCQIEGVIANYKDIDDESIGSGDSRRTPTWMTHKCKNKNKVGKKVEPHCTLHWRLFKSRGGWHAFLMNHNFTSRDRVATQLLIEAGADLFYIVFSYLRYWSVRLNRKNGEIIGKNGMYPYLGDVKRGVMIDKDDTGVIPGNKFNVDLHLKFADMCKSQSPVFGIPGK